MVTKVLETIPAILYCLSATAALRGLQCMQRRGSPRWGSALQELPCLCPLSPSVFELSVAFSSKFLVKMPKSYRNHSKTARNPKRPFEKERLDQELRLLGEYGLKNKREVWRVQYALAKIRSAARELLTLEEKDPRRIFQGTALLRRMVRLGLLSEGEQKLDYVLGLTVQKFLERRLQTRVFKLGLAKSIHHARCLIRQRHIRVGKQIVDIPSFMVRVDSEKYIEFSLTSPYGGGRPGRVKRKALRGGDSKEGDDE